jgi:iron complex outermembrane recepter protein
MIQSRSLRTTLLLGSLLAAMPAAAADTAAGATDGGDDAIVVTGQQVRDVASAATKSALPIAETPQSISVISNQDIAGLGLQNLNQALRFVAGVTPETRGSAAEVYDQFKLRGFDAPIFLDGLKMFGSASGYATPQVDVSRLDRLEVVKGPSSALYGQSGPGGLVAEVSKLPIDRAFYGAVSGSYGNYDLYRVDGDVGGRISDAVLWRLYGSVNGAHQQQTYGKRERRTISGAVTLGANQPTSFTVLAAYSHDPYNGTYGGPPALGTLIPNPAGAISTKLTTGEPNDRFSREQFGLTYIFRHDFGGGWAFRSSGRYQYVSTKLRLVYSSGSPVDATLAAPTVYNRASYATDEKVNSWTFDNQLTGTVETGPLKHNLLVGLDRQVGHSTELAAFGSATPLDFYNPVYGTMATPASPYEVLDYSGTGSFVDPTYYKTHQRQQGVYAQDQISVGGLRLALSGRQDWARTLALSPAVQVKKDKKFTYRVGALYVTPIGVSPYISWSTSFEPQVTVLRDGSIAKPSLGKQLEAGVKYQVPGTEILLTGAWFRIDQTNVVVSYPDFTSDQVGKVRSQGVEIEATAPLPYGFNAKLAFSSQRVKKVQDVVAANIGRPLATVGRGGISANLEWAPKSGPAEGLAIGGAVRHVDRTYADFYTYPDGTSQPMYSPSYTVFDALMRYDLGKLSPRLANVNLAVNATNIFDKKYLTSCFANYGWCWYGNRRTVQGTVSFSW